MTSPKFARAGKQYKGRVYDFGNGIEYPSVTSIIGNLDKPALVPWAANTVTDFAVDHWDSLSQFDPDDRKRMIKSKWRDRRDRAADFGTVIHQFLETGDEPLPGTVEADYVEQARRAIEDFDLTPVRTELTVCGGLGGDLHYAGTADLVAHDGDGDIWLIDWKTGKGIYESHALQVAALAHADHWVNPDGTFDPAPGVTYAVTIRVGQDEWGAHHLDTGSPEYHRTVEAFTGLATVHEWKAQATWTT